MRLDSPFNAADQIINLINQNAINGWQGVVSNTSGTLTQIVITMSIAGVFGSMFSLQIILGFDTDMDDGEAVTFYDDFLTGYVPVVMCQRTDGTLTQVAPQSVTETGFSYKAGSSNFSGSWIAVGLDAVPL